MEEQLKTLIKVLVTAIICISYCYYLPSRIKAGPPRLLSVLPVTRQNVPLINEEAKASLFNRIFFHCLSVKPHVVAYHPSNNRVKTSLHGLEKQNMQLENKIFDREMEEELKNLIKVCVSATSALCYCYFLSTRIKAGVFRLILVLPVCATFLVLPLLFSSSTFCSYTAFYLSLANLKLILFSFDQGPLFPLPPNLPQFIAFTCFPIKLQQNPKVLTHFPKWFFTIKLAIFIVVLHLYDYKQYLPSFLLLGLYPLHTYLDHEIVLTLLKYLVMITLGRDLEPQFNEPYLATSLQDFWGRRWNLMVSDMLRSGIYYPVRRICQHFVNSEWASIIGVLATFVASGVAHEVLYVYLTRELPTGEVTCFFVLHGVCTVVEVLVKKKTFVGRLRVRPIVSRLLTVGFVCLTAGWLFYPQLLRSNVMERHAYEASLFLAFFKRKFYFSW